MSNEITTVSEKGSYVYANSENFENAQRVAKSLASSDLVPKEYSGKMANCLVALEIAHRTNSSPLMVMQNLNIIHGRPSWSSTYIIAAVNASKKFTPLRFEMSGEGDSRQCIAWAKDKDGERLESPVVSIKMAKDEGWHGKSGSKWKTMPELMLRYRAAAFFGRLYAPEILMGMHTEYEMRDMGTVVDRGTSHAGSVVDAINAEFAEGKALEGEIVDDGPEHAGELMAAPKPIPAGPQDLFPGDIPDGMTAEEFYEQTYGGKI